MKSAWALAGALALAGCGASAPPPAPVKREIAPSWADVFDGVPDLYAVVRPRALKHDEVYGAFWGALVRAAQARGFARGATMVETAEGADEIVLGLNRGSDAALVFRGVSASLDPSAMTDEAGRPLFRALTERTRITEYQLADGRAAAGSLFVLPDRTWVGAMGDARIRARQAFARPLGRPAPNVDARALVAVRAGGPLAHVLDRHPTFGPLGRGLASATFTLLPGKGGLVVSLDYADDAATARAEMQARRATQELAKERLPWLAAAKVTRGGNVVDVQVALPPRLLEELPSATGADL